MATYRDDPYSAFNFLVSFGPDPSEIVGSFSEVSGLGVEIEPIEYRNGSEDITVRKIPGLKKFPNVVLKRGIIGDLGLWEWVKAAMDGTRDQRTVVIQLLDESREAVMAFKLTNAWPVKWEGPSLNATANEVAIETLELCHEGLEIE